jgi:hypothetical protein
VQRARFAAGDPGADEVQPVLAQDHLPAAGVLEVSVAAVHHDVARLHVRDQRRDGGVG